MNWLAGFIGLAICLPMVWISLAKVIAIFCILAVYLQQCVRQPQLQWSVGPTLTTPVVAVTSLLFLLGLAWTMAPMDFALSSYVKHSKIVLIPALAVLISNGQRARIALQAWVYGQAVVMVMSWLNLTGLTWPWWLESQTPYVVFTESYIDQSAMFALTGAVAWHLRHARLWKPLMGMQMAAGFWLNVSLLLPGRTGYVLVIAMIGLLVFFEMPRKYRAGLSLAILALASALLLGFSDKAKTRLEVTVSEFREYQAHADNMSSTGWRINAWKRSLQSIQHNPVGGSGTGSWAMAVKKEEGAQAVSLFGAGNSSNPHQEYLLWGVELGVGGTALLVALWVALALDVRRNSPPVRRAMVAAILCAAIACLFNSALYDDLLGDFLCMSLGLLLAYARSEPSSPVPSAAVV